MAFFTKVGCSPVIGPNGDSTALQDAQPDVAEALDGVLQPAQNWMSMTLSTPTVRQNAVVLVAVQLSLATPMSSALVVTQPSAMPARSTPPDSAPMLRSPELHGVAGGDVLLVQVALTAPCCQQQLLGVATYPAPVAPPLVEQHATVAVAVALADAPCSAVSCTVSCTVMGTEVPAAYVPRHI